MSSTATSQPENTSRSVIADTISLVRNYERENNLSEKFPQSLGSWEESLALSASSSKQPDRVLLVSTGNGVVPQTDLFAKLRESAFMVDRVESVKLLPMRFFDHVYIAGMSSDPKTAISYIKTDVKPLLSGSTVSLVSNDRGKDSILEFLRSTKCLTPAEQSEYYAYLKVASNINKQLDNIFREVGFSVRSSGNAALALSLELTEHAEGGENTQGTMWPSPRTLSTKLIKKLEKEQIRLLSELAKTAETSETTETTAKPAPSVKTSEEPEELEELEELEETEEPEEPRPDVGPRIKNPLEIGTIIVNTGNSCYMDSILFPLLANPEWRLSRLLIDANVNDIDKKTCETETDSVNTAKTIKRELNRLSGIICNATSQDESNSHQTCRRFRKILQGCGPLSRFSTREQMDDSEFLVTLMGLFAITPTTVKTTKTYYKDETELIESTGNVETSINERKEAIIEINLDNENSNMQVLDIIELFERSDIAEADDYMFGDKRDKKFMKTTNTLVNIDQFVVFHINRFVNTETGKRKKLKTPVVLVPYIVGRDHTYQLSLITIHEGSTRGGHYYCYFKFDGVWYVYDDTDESTPRRIRWADVVEQGTTGCSILMYEEMKK